MNSRATVLFQPPNHVGLGHINRLSAIALALRKLDPSIRTPFVVEGAAHVLLDVLGLPYIPLPSSHLMEESDSWAGWTKDERSELASEISGAIIKSINPQIVVFDCFPNLALASAALKSKLPIVLCLREMRELDGYLAHIRELLPCISLLLIPHESNAFELPETLHAKSRFVGQIVRPIKTAPDRIQHSTRPLVVITGGGGGYPGTVKFYNLAINALACLHQDHPTLQGRLIAGPLFQDWLRLESVRGIAVIPFEPDMNGAFAAADLVISVAGYNTVAELQQIRTKAILVPAERMWDDQFARARRAAQPRSNFRIFLGSSPADLAGLAQEFLQESLPASSSNSLDGANRAAHCLHSMIKTLS